MLECLEKCYIEQEIVSLYCDPNNKEAHLTGRIYAYNDREIIVEHISPDGYYDGFILIQFDKLYRIDFGGKYEKRIKKLYHYRNQKHPHFEVIESLYCSLVAFAKKNDLVISIELDNVICSGVVIKYDLDLIWLRLVDDDGVSNGETVIRIDEIDSFAVDTDTEQNIRILQFES